MDPTVFSALISALLGGGIVGSLVAFYKAKPERDEAISSAYSRLVGDLRQRIEDLEKDLAAERKHCDHQIRGLRAEIADLRRQLSAG